MPDFYVRSRKLNPRFNVRLADCTEAHAQSVVDQLNADTSAPDDLYYVEQPEPPPARRSWWRRFLNIG